MRKLSILLFALTLMTIATTAKADTALTTCQDIAVAGTYYLTGNIASNYPTDIAFCVNVSVSNVIINMNGYTIGDGSPAGTHVGILVESQNPLVPLTGIEITGGVILDFKTGIVLSSVNGAYVHDMTLLSNHDYGMRMTNINVPGTTAGTVKIWANNFTQGEFGLYMTNVWNANVSYNVFPAQSANNIYGNGVTRSTFVSNTLGVFSQEDCCYDDTFYILGVVFPGTTCISPCTGTGIGASQAIQLIQSDQNRFIQNVVYGSQDMTMTDCGLFGGNLLFYNQFLKFSGNINGVFLDSTSANNYGCGNRGDVVNQGTNNLFDTTCNSTITGGVNCTAGYQCLTNDTLAYISTDCHAVNTTVCVRPIGSLLDPCVSSGSSSYCRFGWVGMPVPTTTTLPYQGVNQTFLDPVYPINATEWNSAGWGWMLPIFSVFFLATMFLIMMVAGAAMVGGPTGGGVAALGLLIVYSVLGIYPIWVAILIGLGGAAIVAKLVLGVGK